MWRALVCWILLVVGAPAYGERLPFRTYTTADGLVNNRVDRGAVDTRGFVWFATLGGVSRFDGSELVSFGTADGLPAQEALTILAAHDGEVFVGTPAGLAWFDPAEHATQPRFHGKPGPAANALVEAAGTIWVGTDRGLARFEHGELVPVPLGTGHQPAVIALAYDARDGTLFLGTWSGLLVRRANGSLESYSVIPVRPDDDRVCGLLVDHTGRLWIGHVGPHVIGVALEPGKRLADGTKPLWDEAGERAGWVRYAPKGWARRGLLEDSRGTIWIGTTTDLVRYQGGAFEELSAARTGGATAMAPCGEDRAGNVWFGSENGAHRLTPSGPVIYDHEDGLEGAVIYGFYQDGTGPLHAIVADYEWKIARRDGDRFSATEPFLPKDWPGAWGTGQVATIDGTGRWWLSTQQGVARYPKVERLEDLATAQPRFYDTRDGLPGRDIFRIYRDRRGDIWVSTLSAVGLARWDHATDRFIAVGADWPHASAVAFAEDHQGALWIGFDDGSLVRVRDGTPRIFGAADGIPDGAVAALLVDRGGRLWLGSTTQGVARIDDPAADHLDVRRYALTSPQVMTLVDDNFGRIYAGTTRGIDRLDPATGSFEHYGSREGLVMEYVLASLRDHDDSLWFATKRGAVHVVPVAPAPVVAPPVYLTRVEVEGVRQPLASGGEIAAPALELAPDQTQIDLDFSAPSFDVGVAVRFQYRLDSGAWSTPQSERTVHFAKLAPGHYVFEVRTVLADGTASPPASLAFVILPPIWLRWWFISLAVLVLVVAAYRLFRWRLAHLLAVERVRSRIASDLHDEIGSSLSRISILSELASRRAAAHEDVHGQIKVIGTSARELVDVASDIVWATDPRRDDLGSLLVRLRTFAADVLESRDIAWTLDAPSDPDRIKLDPDRRRQLYLVIKEAIHNAARHSGASRVEVTIRATSSGLVASVCDDGRGFNESTLTRRGNGLSNMRARASAAGGTLDIRHDAGTQITLRL